MSLQSASLLTGTATIWTGVAITIGALVLLWTYRGTAITARIVCLIFVIVAVANAARVESQLEDNRREIDRITQQLG